MPRRTGITLMETLVAIFVMALGLLALLTLFPLGALNMAQALKDDRCAQCAADADGVSRGWNIRQDADVQAALYNPDPAFPPGFPQLVPPLTSSWFAPSYPVYIDPVGWLEGGGPSPLSRAINGTDTHFPTTPPTPTSWAWVGSNRTLIDLAGMPYSGVPRRSLRFLNDYPTPPGFTDGDPNMSPANLNLIAYRAGQLQKWCSLLDDMTFQSSAQVQSGTPGPAPTYYGIPVQSLDREGRYSWAYLARLTYTTQPNIVDLCTVVYSGRSMTLTGAGQIAGEHGYAATFTQGSKTVTVRWNPAAEEAPPIRKGIWVMDGTLVSPQVPPGTMVPDPHGYFYRVVNVTDGGASGAYQFLQLELQYNSRANTSTLPDPQGFSPGYWGRLVVLENVVEVFDRGS
jgi:hypothetical protein